MCEEEKEIAIPDSVVSSIVQAMLTVPLPFAQVCVPGLERYSQRELERMFHQVLTNPPEAVNVSLSVSKPRWSDEEDFLLLTFRNSGMSSVTEFLRENGQGFKACRTVADLEKRLDELGRMSKKEVDAILARLARQTVMEERFYKCAEGNGEVRAPQLEQCHLMPVDRPDMPLSKGVAAEIEQLEKLVPFFAAELFEVNDIALLMGMDVRFSMRQRLVVIGRATTDTSVDIDLGFLNEHICAHVSRLQATLQIMPDGNFYIENIGNSIFRVSGKIIRPKQFCKVPSGALLDFAGNILIFIPNKPLVDRIVKELNKHMRHVKARLQAEAEEAGHDRP